MGRAGKVFIRADASVTIGTGHVMRCLALAERMRGAGLECRFVCRILPDLMKELIEENGFSVSLLGMEAGEDARESDAIETTGLLARFGPIDWLLVDHYDLGEAWERRMRPYARRIAVIDDWTDRRHDCDLLLNANVYDDASAFTQKAHVPGHCATFLGPGFALLRRAFEEAGSRIRDGRIRRLLVGFGGGDAVNLTGRTLEALTDPAFAALQADVVIGSGSAHAPDIRAYRDRLPGIRVHEWSGAMPALMAGADLAIGAAGVSAWERCCLALPALIVTAADNQEAGARYLGHRGAAVYLGRHDEVSTADIGIALRRLLAQPAQVAEMSERASRAMAGRSAEWPRLMAVLTDDRGREAD
ncbi:UDP-2,4-diacetamido-2,4,6-trideoxy-beta-L-altropyranose hydrolase [Cohnella sp. GCM10020058]|uniref:UDP-2,4-diacetamido-2,4, 6-trideoxy-beta-L-altropyranose hydrolase n=1 Tax=Cohnella sp. GCM10020058 TaxID=3317330 RepID=UPI003636C060